MRDFYFIRASCLLAFLLMLPWAGRAQESAVPNLEMPAEQVEEDLSQIVAVPDSVLRMRLGSIFSQIDAFSRVEATVTEGVVRLRGTVQRPEDRRRVEDLTSSLAGVVYVVNDVEAATDVETRLAPALNRVEDSWRAFVRQLPVLLIALIVILLFAFGAFLLGRWRRPGRWTRLNPLVWGFLNRLMRAVLIVIGLLLALDILGITSMMGAVLGTAGIVGLAVGFAFRDIVENYLAGMLLSLRRPFTVSDFVQVGEFEGRIVRLTSREVILLTLEGNNVRLPNSHVFKSPLINYTANPRRLFHVQVGVGVSEDLRSVMDTGVDMLKRMPGIMQDPMPFARVVELGESSTKVRFFGWVDQREADFLKVRSEATRLVKEALDEAGIELPEPIVRVRTEAIGDGDSRPPRQKRSPSANGPETIDVRPDGKLDEQVREDLARSSDENLLE